MKAHIRIGILSFIISFTTVFAFQNCGQAGSINDTSSFENLNKFAISDPAADQSDNSGLDIVAPHDDSSPDSNDTNNETIVIPPDDEITPPQEDSNEVVQITDPTQGSDSDDDTEFEEIAGACSKKISVAQVNLAVDYVSLAGGMIVLDAEGQNLVLSSSENSIKLKALADSTLSQLRIVLKDQGNSITMSDNVTYSLKTPSAQQSGLKFHLDQDMEIKKDSMYELTVDVDLDKQVVKTKKKCIFKPVIKSARLL